MPSSTSNSEHVASQRCPQNAWGRTWILAVTLTFASLLTWESFLRQRGYRPTIVDNAALWSLQRDRVTHGDPNRSIVCLGDCRMELGFVPSLLRNRLPGYQVTQLAVEATSPMATLRDLASDETFRGIVLCGITAREFCDDMWDTQQPYVDYYHREYTWNTSLNRRLANLVQQNLAFVHPMIRLDDVAVSWFGKGVLPDPYYLETRVDRSRAADYAEVDIKDHQNWTINRLTRYFLNRDAEDPNAGPLTPEKWLAWALRSEPDIQAIQDRGGKVVYIRFPTTGRHYMFEETAFTKNEFWDVFAKQTAALTIHFKDYPELADYPCPDLSHLDRRDAPSFTLALIDILERQGVLPPSPWAPKQTSPSKPKQGRLPKDFNPFEEGGDPPADFNPFEEGGDPPADFNPFEETGDPPADFNPFEEEGDLPTDMQ